MEEGNEIYVKVVDSYGLSKIRRTLTDILDEFQIRYDREFKPRIKIKGPCGDIVEKIKVNSF